jgi:hypothetical protein
MREMTKKIRLQNLFILFVLLSFTFLSGCNLQKHTSAATNPKSKQPVETKSPEIRGESVQNKHIENIQWVESDDIKPGESTIITDKIPENLTAAKFNDIRQGMSYEEVSELLGGEGLKVSILKINDRETLTYKWATDDFKKYIDVTLENNKVIKKMSKGL